MEGLFGWSSSSIQEWFQLLSVNLSNAMVRYHKSFLSFKGFEWQRQSAALWAAERCDENMFQHYYRFHLEYHLKLPFALDATVQLDFVMK
jgi:hypothetical protein